MLDKILVVDDDPDMLMVLRWALASIGGVLEASNGPSALRLVESERPRLVLLDVTMPEMGGLEVLKETHVRDPSIIVVMLTGQSDIAIAKEALDNGARAYITKPFDEKFLCAEVRRLLDPGDQAADAGEASGCPWRVLPH